MKFNDTTDNDLRDDLQMSNSQLNSFIVEILFVLTLQHPENPEVIYFPR